MLLRLSDLAADQALVSQPLLSPQTSLWPSAEFLLIVVFPVLHWDRNWVQDSTCAHDVRNDVQMGVITSATSCPPVDKSVSLLLEFCYVGLPVTDGFVSVWW